jgi:sulfatase maturation enzyme AslB (radical SAM superfamily)
MRVRRFSEHNYKSFFIDGKTMRIKLDPSKPITDLAFPEFYDIKITNKCSGNCSYCYQDAGVDLYAYSDSFNKLWHFFGQMSENERPFQVALGGGNPNEHPDFVKILKLFNYYNIIPNYTTNGMGLTEEIIDATKEYCGGVAISCHEHLGSHWRNAIQRLHDKVQTNLHIIISDKYSIDRLRLIYESYQHVIKYFVLLPYEATGRAAPKDIEYDYLTQYLSSLPNLENIAFGANFYKYLCTSNFKLSLYEPEIFSKYLDCKDMKLYKSSFNLTEV